MIGEETLTGSEAAPPGSTGVIDSFSPADGELYYVDDLTVASDGGGSNTQNFTYILGIRAGDTSNPSSPDSVAPYTDSQQVSVSVSQEAQESGTLGVYLPPGRRVLVVRGSNFDTSANFDYTVGIRQIL